MLVVFIRSIILYIAVLISQRIMGKSEIAEMNCFDLVITLLIAEVASTPMENNDIPIIYGLSALSALVFIETFVSMIGMKFRRIDKFIVGQPTILINKGLIDLKQLRKERVTINELLEQLRVQGYFNITQIQYAILETDGNLSIVPLPNYSSTPPREFKHLPITLIVDGDIINENLKTLDKDKKWLYNILKSHHIKSHKEVLLCMLDEYDKIIMQLKDNK